MYPYSTAAVGWDRSQFNIHVVPSHHHPTPPPYHTITTQHPHTSTLTCCCNHNQNEQYDQKENIAQLRNDELTLLRPKYTQVVNAESPDGSLFDIPLTTGMKFALLYDPLGNV